MNKMASISLDMEPGVEKALGVVYPKYINLGSKKYCIYISSLTTPPCT